MQTFRLRAAQPHFLLVWHGIFAFVGKFAVDRIRGRCHLFPEVALMHTTRSMSEIPLDVLRARRRSLAADLAKGLLPAPSEFVAAGLPVLIRACDLVEVADVIESVPTALVRCVLGQVSAAERCGWTVPGGAIRRNCR
jgi:hypothetical protein